VIGSIFFGSFTIILTIYGLYDSDDKSIF
jgi:hypothetical protein